MCCLYLYRPYIHKLLNYDFSMTISHIGFSIKNIILLFYWFVSYFESQDLELKKLLI